MKWKKTTLVLVHVLEMFKHLQGVQQVQEDLCLPTGMVKEAD